jgi:Flp pilus assembly protein TadD
MIRTRPSLVFAATVLLASACTGENADTATQQGSSSSSSSDAALMAQGTELLYQKNDAAGAERVFRQILQHNPEHYGAHYQLAVAVDRGGRPAEARPMFQDMLKRAQASSDTATIRLVQTRLAAPDTVGADGMMALGVNLLYNQSNAAAAAEQFRKVLALKPTHYGANYQLAVALDRSGKPTEARVLWEKVLGMATAINDQQTIETARTRLKQTP